MDEQEALGGGEGQEDELQQRYDALEAEATKTQEVLESNLKVLEFPDPEQMAVVGAIVFVGHDGKLKVESGLIRREDMRRGSAANSGKFGSIGTIEEEKPVEKPVHSEKLTRMLTAPAHCGASDGNECLAFPGIQRYPNLARHPSIVAIEEKC